jgi:hypothetical protein
MQEAIYTLDRTHTYSARFGPDLAAKSTFGASLKPLFRQLQGGRL